MALIDRTSADALIPTEFVREVQKTIPEASAVMRLAKRLPDMSAKQSRIPVVSALPTAYFVNGDTGQKQTTAPSWDKVFLTAEEIAVIVPIPEAVLDDSDYDIWAESKPLIEEAFGLAIDRAILYGTNKPASWPSDIVTAATAAGNKKIVGAAFEYDDLLGEDGVIAKLEADGFMATGHIGAMSMRGKLRGLKDTTGQPLFRTGMTGPTNYELDGTPLVFPKNGSIDPAQTLLVSGDWSQLVYAFRQDMTYKILTEATIYDTDGTTILYRLAQQDMVALRCVMRVAFALPNPINRLNTGASRYPFAFLNPAAT